jgi:HEPN domain-containing protein
MKGLLYHEGADTVLGHSVAAPCQDVRTRYPELTDPCARWAALDQQYMPTRYPDALPGGTPADVYTLEQAEAATATAREVLDEMQVRT